MLTIQSHDEMVQVKKILQEDEERFNHFLVLLEEWMNCHAFLPKYYEKQMLPIFLRNCKYNLEKTKQKLELYFVYKKRYPELFCFHEFNTAEKNGLDNFYVFEASNLSPDGYRVGFGGIRLPDATGCDMNVVNKLLTMLGIFKANKDVINRGLIVVLNAQNMSPMIASGMFNANFKRFVKLLQKVYPIRIGGVYRENKKPSKSTWQGMLTFWESTSPVNKHSVDSLKVVFIEEGDELMKENIPKNCLPKEFGGTDGTVNENTAKCIQTIIQAKTWMLESEKIQIVGDIPKDLYEMSGIDDNFGTHGSFRKLEVD